MNKTKDDLKIQLLIALIGAVLFIPFLGHVHLFDWDEINFAECAREMIISKDYLTVQINFKPFWEKPPLFIWMQVLSMKIFGINEFAARFPNAIAGIIVLLVLYNIGKKLKDRNFGIWWTVVYAGSFLPFFYFKSGIIDPWFNLFIFLGIYFIYLFSIKESKNLKYVFLSAVSIGLGIMTKGPVALLIWGLVSFIYMILSGSYKKFLNIKVIGIYAITVTLVGGFWFILQILNGKVYLIADFIQYQIRLFSQKDAGHGGFLFYHFVILLFGVFPASFFALKNFGKFKTENDIFKQWMKITFWTVLILFTIVKTKIVHYSSMCYFPLTYLGADIIYKITNKKENFNKWLKISIVIYSLLVGISVIALTRIDTFKDIVLSKGLIKDAFAAANLQADGQWSGIEFIPALFLIIGIPMSLTFKNVKKQIASIFISSTIFMYSALYLIVPHIERYSQNAAIEFFKSKAAEDCYITTYGYKSYAHYFYSSEKPSEAVYAIETKRDKPFYIVCKINKKEEFEKKFKNFKEIKNKNGFVFYKKIEK